MSTAATGARDPARPPAGILRRLCPRYLAAAVGAIEPARLARHGIRAVILDLDNTLVPWHGDGVGEEIAAWIARLQAAGFRICIASNTHRPRRLRRLADHLQVTFAPGCAKPRRGGFLRAMERMGSRPEETAVIGDQVLTDIWGGNRCGLLTILVDPLSPREFIGTRLVSRPLERWLMARFRARGWLCDWTDNEEACLGGRTG
jgi:HAD superfamily phosphatase (TIGR01668 family)